MTQPTEHAANQNPAPPTGAAPTAPLRKMKLSELVQILPPPTGRWDAQGQGVTPQPEDERDAARAALRRTVALRPCDLVTERLDTGLGGEVLFLHAVGEDRALPALGIQGGAEGTPAFPVAFGAPGVVLRPREGVSPSGDIDPEWLRVALTAALRGWTAEKLLLATRAQAFGSLNDPRRPQDMLIPVPDLAAQRRGVKILGEIGRSFERQVRLNLAMVSGSVAMMHALFGEASTGQLAARQDAVWAEKARAAGQEPQAAKAEAHDERR